MKRIVAGLISLLLSVVIGVPVVAAPSGTSISLTVPTSPVYASAFEFSAAVRDSSGNAVPNELVTFTFSGPVVAAYNHVVLTVRTDAFGIAQAALTPTNSDGLATISITASIQSNTVVSTTTTRKGIFVSPSRPNLNVMSFTLDAPSTAIPGKSLAATATLATSNGTPISGVRVGWGLTGPGRIAESTGVTDNFGRVSMRIVYGADDLGTSFLTATAQIAKFKLIQTAQIALSPPTKISVEISQAKDLIKLEILGASESVILVDIDGSVNLVDITQDLQVVTFSAQAKTHIVSVFIEEVLYAKKTLTFPNFINPQIKTITCRALDRVIAVTGLKPTCPSPFKLSKTPMPANAKVTLCYKPGFTLAMAKPLTKCPTGYSR